MISKAGTLLLVLLGTAARGAAAQSTPDEPFAVVSRGRPAPHVERAVVVLRDTLPPRGAADSARVATGRPDSVRPAARAGAAASPGASGGTRRDTTRAGAARPDTAPAASRAPSGRGSAAAAATRPPAGPPGAPAARPPASARTRRVVWGDTWYGIARELGVTPAALQAANPDVDPERLASGTLLRIPTPGSAAARRSHRVSPGESLWGIARRYGVSTESIREANALDGDRVRTGDTLIIPGGE